MALKVKSGMYVSSVLASTLLWIGPLFLYSWKLSIAYYWKLQLTLECGLSWWWEGKDCKGIWDSGTMRGVVAIQIFMKTEQNKASHLVYIFPVPKCYLLTQGESGLPRLHNSDYPPLLSLKLPLWPQGERQLQRQRKFWSWQCNHTVIYSKYGFRWGRLRKSEYFIQKEYIQEDTQPVTVAVSEEVDWETGVTRRFTFHWTPFLTISTFLYHEHVIASQK